MLMTAQVKLKAASRRRAVCGGRGSQGASISIRPPFNRTPVISELIFTAGRQLGAPTTAIYPEPSPNDGHPSASDLASNASDGVRRVAAAVSRAAAPALGEEVAHGRHREEP